MASKNASWVIAAALVGLILGWLVGHSGFGSRSVRYQAVVMPGINGNGGILYLVDTDTGRCLARDYGSTAWVDIGPVPGNTQE